MRSKRDGAHVGGLSAATSKSTSLAMTCNGPANTISAYNSDPLSKSSVDSLASVKVESDVGEIGGHEQRHQTHAANSKLCRMVRRSPWLYNRNHSNYGKKHVLDKTWLKIAKECNDTVASCKERWRNIRAAYARSVNIYKTNSGPNRVKPYYLHKELNFLLKPMLEGRGKNSLISSEESSLPMLTEATVGEEMVDNDEVNKSVVKQNGDTSFQFQSQLESIKKQVAADVNGNEEDTSPGTPRQYALVLPEMHECATSYKVVDEANSNGNVSSVNTNHRCSSLESFPTNVNHQTNNGNANSCDANPKQTSLISNGIDKHICSSWLSDAPQGNRLDADVKFLEALLPDLRAMNSRQKIVFKRKIYQTLEEVFENNSNFPSATEKRLRLASATNLSVDTLNHNGNIFDTVPLPQMSSVPIMPPVTVVLPRCNVNAGMENFLPTSVKEEPDDVAID